MLPIEPYLIELLQLTDDEFPLIVAGGLGIYLKRRWTLQQLHDGSRRSRFRVIPEARTTDDIDAFLSMELFSRETSEGVARLRARLEQTGYVPYEKARYFQFVKSIDRTRTVKFDLHARLPTTHEETFTKVDEPRIGRKGHTAFRQLHAYATPEAFAIDEGVQTLPLSGTTPLGARFEGRVRVPHPFASLCMKLCAALDHERALLARRKPRGEKHASDVYLLVAMLDEAEFDQTQALARRFADEPPMARIRAAITELFAAPEQAGLRTIALEARKVDSTPLELELFSTMLGELFGTGAAA